MLLENIKGSLVKREPGVGFDLKNKIIYIEYNLLRQPVKLTDIRNAPAPQSTIIDIFKKRLLGYGFDLNNLGDWKLYIDARDDYWIPHEDIPETFEFISTIFKKKNICILTNSVFDATDVEYTIDFYPTAAANHQSFFDKLMAKNIDFYPITLDKHFIALARRPTNKRVRFIKELLDNFGDSLRASCGTRGGSSRSTIIVSKPKDINHLPISSSTEVKITEEVIPYEELFAPYKYPMTIDGDTINDHVQHLAFDYKFFSAIVNIISETMEDDDSPINLSEKTFKAFAWHQIPIWHASPNTVNEVRKLGFDLFDDIIDHSYDTVTTYDVRKEKVMNNLREFKNRFPTLNDITQLRESIYPRLVYNQKILADLANTEREILVKNLYRTGK